ncbi:MAG: hypothetical protein QOF02_2247 [Blastocatellia bacterium]|jgi:hypothetical protein|nr:hypothetical protein [Blastocatellia bacterium]
MKKTLLLLMGLTITLLMSSCSSCGRTTEPPASKETVYVYTFESPAAASPDDSKKLIEKFLGTSNVGDLYKSDENTVYYVSKDDVSETFEHDLNNGNITYNKSMKKYMGDFVPQLPSREEAIKMAEEFLNKNALQPGNMGELRLAHFGGLRASSVIDGKKAGPVIDELVALTYGRTIDNMPVMGPGSKIVVNIGDKGEVMGLIRRWRELSAGSKKQVQPEEMISQREAEEMARRQIMSEYGEKTPYQIIGSSKAYYDNNGKILQPVYIFETTINIPSREQNIKPINYLCVIPMLKNSPEPLNLTAIDPRAKEAIKSIKQGEVVPDQNRDKKIDE